MLRDAASLPEKIPRTQLYLPTHQEAGVEEFSKNLKARKFRSVTCSKFHNEDLQTLGAGVQKFICNKDMAPGISAPLP